MTAGEVSQQTELPTSTTTRVLDRLERSTGSSNARPTRTIAGEWSCERGTRGFAGAGTGGADDPYADILAGMHRVHEEFTVDELEVVARYLDAMKDVR